jgi:prevent-host-death family protein
MCVKAYSRGIAMKTATVGEIQKNFAGVLREIKAGEEIIVTRRGEPVARITSIGPRSRIDWPDFFEEAIEVKGKSLSETVVETREDRF